MMTSLLLMTMFMSIIFMIIEHPLSMGLVLLAQTTLIALITGSMTHNYWFSYILFMIMIGGMLVLFIYMTSVASNEKFLFSNKLMKVSSVMVTSLILGSSLHDQFLTYQLSLNSDTPTKETIITYALSMSKYLTFPLNSWMIALIIYLLLALIAVVKITNITYGPLRQKL